nr:hypothetical protein [Tanacetum cinerariifolium]
MESPHNRAAWPRPALLVQGLRGGAGRSGRSPGPSTLLRRPASLDQRQVNVIGLELGQALLEARDQFVRSEVVGPDLGGDVKLVTRHTALLDGLADFGFVAIDLCGVDDAIAQLQAGADRVDDDLIFEAERAEAKCGNSHWGLHGSGGKGNGSDRMPSIPCRSAGKNRSAGTGLLPGDHQCHGVWGSA